MFFSFPSSKLYNEKTFYKAFLNDLAYCQKEVIIESPYITATRMEMFHPVFEELLKKKVKVTIVTRDPIEHEDEHMRHQATNEILYSKEMGVNIVLLRGYHHRKLAILDRKILWEGSLNILSQTKSIEIMRRIDDKQIVKEIYKFTNLRKLF